jgi:hypothetical protein
VITATDGSGAAIGHRPSLHDIHLIAALLRHAIATGAIPPGEHPLLLSMSTDGTSATALTRKHNL